MLGAFLTLASWVLAVPLAVVGVECLAALRPKNRARIVGGVRPRFAVIVPAHDEAAGIGAVLPPLARELAPGDRLIVIADNCTDRTAEIARAAGATVLERQDSIKRGKGYALDFAIRHLEEDPPEVVVIVDADCKATPGTLATIAEVAAVSGRPTQALYVFAPPPSPTLRDQLSAFALIVRNVARPVGADRLGIACALQGSGMAFPWRVIKDATLASGNLVEDMQLGIDLAIAGTPAHLVESGRVEGSLPGAENAKQSQRTRWEHGHLATIGAQVPRLLREAVKQRRPDLFGLALDLAVPPLALLAAFTGVFFAGALAYALATGDTGPFQPAAAAGLLMAAGIVAAQLRYGREVIELRTLLAAPFYVLWKVPIYARFVLKREKKWVRTSRD